MSRNPYGTPLGTDPHFDDARPPRVSALAVSSLVCGLLCCLPGVGLLGTILGGAAMVRISTAQGRLTGRGMAFAAMLLGLLGTVVWIAIAFGAMASVSMLTTYGKSLEGLARGDRQAIRGVLSGATSAKVTDEQIDAFKASVEAELGKFQRMPKGVAEWLEDFEQTQNFNPSMPSPTGQRKQPDVLGIPMHFERGVAVVAVHTDPSGVTANGVPMLRNISVHTKSGAIIWLIPPPASSAVPAPPASPATPSTGPPPKPEAKPETKPETKPESKPETKPETTPPGAPK